MNKEKWETLLKEFWMSEDAPDELSLREGLIVKSFAEFCMKKESAQQSFALDGVPPCSCKKFVPLEDNPEFCAVCKKPRRK